MAEIQISEEVSSTEAFAALADISIILGAHPNKPESPEELKARYQAVYQPKRAGRGLKQSRRTINGFIEQFDMFQAASRLRDGEVMGRLVCGDESVIEAVAEHHHETVDTDSEVWTYKFRATSFYLRRSLEQPIDDLLLTTCYRDSFLGRYVQENVYTGLDVRYAGYLSACAQPRSYKWSVLDAPSYNNFRRYLGVSHTSEGVQRAMWYPTGSRYSAQLFDFVANLPEVAEVAPV